MRVSLGASSLCRLGLVLVVTGSSEVQAQPAVTFIVTRGDDPAPGPCTPDDCSLREAVIAGNTAVATGAALLAVIELPAGTYALSIPGSDDTAPNAAVGDLDVLVNIDIVGAGANATFVESGESPFSGIHRLFDVYGHVHISHLTIRNGFDVEDSSGGCIRNHQVLDLKSVLITGCGSRVGGGGLANYGSYLEAMSSTISSNQVRNPSGSTVSGGGFLNAGTMYVHASVITGNGALNAGGGINVGTIAMYDSIVSDNKARFDVGGIRNDGTMTVYESTFSGNASGVGCSGAECSRADAGGLLNTAGGTMNVNNSTISGNSCLVSGGGIMNADGTLTVSSTTIASNTCGLGAGLTANDTVYLKNSILADNTADSSAGDCSGTITSQGYNLVENTTGCLVVGDLTGNLTGVDPGLGPLQNNGGFTPTRALMPGSPAFNSANPGFCLDHGNRGFDRDQRGHRRSMVGRCDMGAFEVAPSVLLWTSENAAEIWFFHGALFVGMTGSPGPWPGFTAQSYVPYPPVPGVGEVSLYAQLLWAADIQALDCMDYLGELRFRWDQCKLSHDLGAGWMATSIVHDDMRHVLWTTDNQALVRSTIDYWIDYCPRPPCLVSEFGLSGPGPGWRATSYFRAADGSHRVLWTADNQAQVWTLTPSVGWGGMIGLGGPGPGWTATSYQLNADGSFNVVWTSSGLAHVWTITSTGTFGGMVGLTNPAGGSWTLQSFTGE